MNLLIKVESDQSLEYHESLIDAINACKEDSQFSNGTLSVIIEGSQQEISCWLQKEILFINGKVETRILIMIEEPKDESH